MTIVWDGIVSGDTLSPAAVKLRHELADAARRYDWAAVQRILREWPDLANTTRPDGASLFGPLHQAAYGGAPQAVAAKLVQLGCWRNLQNARGERPIDVAQRRGQAHLLDALLPVLVRDVPSGILLKIQSYFHEVIQGRAAEQVRAGRLRLPELEPLLELDEQRVWFAVPGMYGGFAYELKADGVAAVLETSSWCRLVEGSGQRHAITSDGIRLVEEGFV